MQGTPYQMTNHFHIRFPHSVYILWRHYSHGTTIELLEKGVTNTERGTGIHWYEKMDVEIDR